MILDIPHFKQLALSHLVLDYNGTLAKDGILKEEARHLLGLLSEKLTLHVITADTFGTVTQMLSGVDVTLQCLRSDNHTEEKGAYLESLQAESCVAIGNGNNDALMLKKAAIGIAIIGEEGCSTEALQNSDLCCRSIEEALELLLYPKRLVATLRR